MIVVYGGRLRVDEKLENASQALRDKNWKEFRKSCRKGKLYIVGCGKNAREFAVRYGNKFRIAGLLDNDKSKLGKTLREITDCEYDIPGMNLKIASLDMLKDRDCMSGIFLITPSYGYGDLEKQLRQHGCRNMYSYYIMESKKVYFKAPDVIENIRKSELFSVYEFYRNRKYSIDRKKIVFSAFGTYCDHGKYITEELLRQNKGYDLVWVVQDNTVKVPQGVRIVPRGDIKRYIYEMATAKIWIFNSPVQAFVRKRRGQVYIQTKHWTGITLKKFYMDADTVTKNKERMKLWKRNSRIMDYIITASEFDTQSCLRGFRPKGKCVELGSARTDVLFNAQGYREKVLGQLELPETARLVIYAPTYRFQWSGEHYEQMLPEYNIDYGNLIDGLGRKFGGQWYVLLRLHPGLRKYSEQVHLADRVINISQYPDAEEFIAASDILITDYSSIMFDPAYVKKTVILYATDIDEYLKNDYDLLLDIRSLPFPLAESNGQLLQIIQEFDYESYRNRLEQFLDAYHVMEDGSSCKRIVEFIDNLIN